MGTKSETVRVPITPELRAELEAIASLHDVSLAHVIRLAIRYYLLEREGRDEVATRKDGKGRG